ncbi:MAG: prepilin-type N-terminal cleavage/methylation domain-containing protein [Puniceicoccales bacterium]
MNSRLRSHSAFTLVELLTVIAVIGILGALIFAALGSAQKSAQRAGGANVLRQTGAAIKLYAQENGGSLPGQVPIYEENETERLSYKLAPYLDVPKQTTGKLLVEGLVPPAFPIDELGSEPRTFIVNDDAMNPNNNSRFNPWGSHPDIADPSDPTASTPHNYFKLVSPARTWAVMDVDQEHPRVAAGWASSTPEKPIHGSVRHALFFDGHVEAVPLDYEL